MVKYRANNDYFSDPLADPLGTRRGPPLVRGPQSENRCVTLYTVAIACYWLLLYLTSLSWCAFAQSLCE